MTERFDVAIVGAGMAGLTAANLVHRAGHRVVVLDAHHAGGRGRTTWHGEFRFNQGAHALYLAGPAARILGQLGIRPTGGPPAPHPQVLTGGELHPLPASAGSLVRSKFLSVRSKAQLGGLLAALPKLDAATLKHRTVAEWLDGEKLRPDARALMETILRVASYVNAPDLMSAGVAVEQLQLSLAAGVLYMDGGWQAMIDRLRDGLDVREGTEVLAVRPDGNEYVLDGADVAASAVIVAAGTPAAAARLTGVDLDPEGRLGPPAEVACLDLGLRHPAAHPLVFPMDRPLYLSTHCPPADLAPAGHVVVHVMHYLAPGTQHGPAEARAELAGLATVAGIDDDAIVEARYLHRMTAVPAIPLAAHGGQAGRPGVEVRERPGLFLAGDWVGPRGHLLDASVASAEDAATAAERHLARIAV